VSGDPGCKCPAQPDACTFAGRIGELPRMIDFATFEQAFGVAADEFNTDLSCVRVLSDDDVKQMRRANRMGHDGTRMGPLPVEAGFAEVEFDWPCESYHMAKNVAHQEAINMRVHATFVAVSCDYGSELMRYYFRPADPAGS
jgi:hypothetical protein